MLRYIADKFNIKRNYKPWHNISIPDEAINRIISLSGLKEDDLGGMKMLDFGCGNGRYLEAFSRKFSLENVVGVDVDTDDIAITHKKGINAFALNPQKAELPFDDEAFDFIFTSNVIEHIPYTIYLSYIDELRRVLKPDGVLFVCAPNYPVKRLYDMKRALFSSGEERLYYFFDDPTHCNRQNVFTVEKQFSEHFRKVDFFATEIFFERVLRFLKNQWFQRKLRVFGNKFIGICVK